MSISSEQGTSNYAQDRSANFKHQVPEGLIPKGIPTVQDYVQAEKSKQMSKMRDWYLEAKSSRTDCERASFSKSRQCLTPEAEMQNPKNYLPWCLAIVAIAAVITITFVHF